MRAFREELRGIIEEAGGRAYAENEYGKCSGWEDKAIEAILKVMRERMPKEIEKKDRFKKGKPISWFTWNECLRAVRESFGL